ncbi:hypothetical protein EPN83_01670 [Patescibacteria group bacterium]|nr:MAG: hypothetical protein EPN83_01670 [Patescibacteria group bacterium]
MTILLAILIGSVILFWILHKLDILRFCPICSAVALTWLVGLLLLYATNLPVDPLFIAILTGASLGALAEKYGSKFGFFWKTILVVLGSAGIYLLVIEDALKALILFSVVALVTVMFVLGRLRRKASEDKFKDCC